MRSKVFSLTVIWFISVISYVLGLYFPLISTRSQLLGITINSQSIRLFDSINLFYNNNEFFLAFIIFSFTIVLPIVKYIEIIIRLFSPNIICGFFSKILHLLDKWSMLDVFIVALLLLNFKMNSSIIVMKLMIGTTFLAISIVLRMLVTFVYDLNHRT
jgi:uncharacterized paraquat-inducible protein A